MVQPVLAYVRTSPTKVQPEWRHQRQARDASGCLRLRPASAYQPLVCVGRPHRGLCSTQVLAAAAGEEILHDSVTGLVGNVFGTVRAQLEQQQQEQPERQQRESASAPPAEAPRGPRGRTSRAAPAWRRGSSAQGAVRLHLFDQ